MMYFYFAELAGVVLALLLSMLQVIAPPGLRVLDWVWKVFVCRCPAWIT
jgi:hypothetical protein